MRAVTPFSFDCEVIVKFVGGMTSNIVCIRRDQPPPVIIQLVEMGLGGEEIRAPLIIRHAILRGWWGNVLHLPGKSFGRGSDLLSCES